MSPPTSPSPAPFGSHPTASGLERGSPADLGALLFRVLAMRPSQGPEPSPSTSLPGRNLALICGSEDDAAAALFVRAATGLGARVSRLSSRLVADGAVNGSGIARMLGRLYDAVECLGLTAETVNEIARSAGVPVYGGLACAGHPTAALLPLLGLPPDEARVRVIQAALVATLERS